MNPSELPTGKPSPSSSNKDPNLPLPRQHSLKVGKKSHKIIKNAPSPSPPPRATHHHHQAPPESINQKDKPQVFYHLPPRTIHVSPDNFKDLVQRLTGKPPDNEQPAGPSSVSPATRLASIERTVPKKKETFSWSSRDEDGVQMGPFPGILSSEPSALPSIPSENFTQAAFQPIPSENISQSQVTLSPISSQNFSPMTYPPTPWNIFSPETLPTMPLMPSEYFPTVSMPPTPSEFLPPVITPTRPFQEPVIDPENMWSEFFLQKTSPWTPFQEPDIDPQSQTVLPENSIFASSSDTSLADAVPPQTPPNKFSPLDFK